MPVINGKARGKANLGPSVFGKWRQVECVQAAWRPSAMHKWWRAVCECTLEAKCDSYMVASGVGIRPMIKTTARNYCIVCVYVCPCECLRVYGCVYACMCMCV